MIEPPLLSIISSAQMMCLMHHLGFGMFLFHFFLVHFTNEFILDWRGRPATQHGHNHSTCVILMAQMTCHLGLGMFFFSLLLYFTNKFIFYLLMMPWWCPTSAVASTTTTIRWCGRPATWHSHNDWWPNAMAHHHHLYHHHHLVTWRACNMTQPQHCMSIISSAQTTCLTCCLGFGMFVFFISFYFVLLTNLFSMY